MSLTASKRNVYLAGSQARRSGQDKVMPTGDQFSPAGDSIKVPEDSVYLVSADVHVTRELSGHLFGSSCCCIFFLATLTSSQSVCYLHL